MANKYRGEVDFPVGGRATFIRFSLHDFAEIEAAFGKQFWTPVEISCVGGADPVPSDIMALLAIGLKCRDAEGKVSRVWGEFDLEALLEDGFSITSAGRPIIEALSWSYLQKSYDDLLKEAAEAQKKRTADAIKQIAEAANEAGLPFKEEDLLKSLLRLGIVEE